MQFKVCKDMAFLCQTLYVGGCISALNCLGPLLRDCYSLASHLLNRGGGSIYALRNHFKRAP